MTSPVRLRDGQRIPTFEEFLELARARDAYAFVEFKTEPTRTQLDAVMRTVNRLGMRDRILINSFDAGRLARIRAVVGSDVDYSWVASSGTQPVLQVRAAGDTFNKQVVHLARAQLDAYVAAGIRTYGWTLDEPEQWAQVQAWPLAGVVTNRPIAYAAWRAADQERCRK